MNHTEEKLGTESLGSLMLSMGIPTLVAQMINLLYNIVDRVYIGQGVGREALTGLGLALPAITIVSAFSALAGAGGAPLAAIALGQGDREKAERITGNVFTLRSRVFFSPEALSPCSISPSPEYSSSRAPESPAFSL